MAQVGARYLMKQLVWGGLGLAACVAIAMVDYRRLKKVWWMLFGLAIIMLVLVLNKHFGTVHGHARRWFRFRPHPIPAVGVGQDRADHRAGLVR